jgi:hypothetical protein
MRYVYPNLFMTEKDKTSEVVKGIIFFTVLILFIGTMFIAGTMNNAGALDTHMACFDHPSYGKVCMEQ